MSLFSSKAKMIFNYHYKENTELVVRRLGRSLIPALAGIFV